jgi:trk system potassium uptake protein TrkA
MLLKNLGIVTHKVRRALIVGGGTLSYYLAQRLGTSFIDATIMEANEARCVELATLLPEVDVIHGDPREDEILDGEELSEADALIALTDSDELNMVLSLYAHQRKLPQVVTILEQLATTGITEHLPLGSVICPRQLCCSNVVRYVRAMQNQTGAAVSVHPIADGQVEALEFKVDDTTEHVGETLKDIKLRPNLLVVSITQHGRTEIPNGNSQFQEGDTLVVVTSGRGILRRFDDIFA